MRFHLGVCAEDDSNGIRAEEELLPARRLELNRFHSRAIRVMCNHSYVIRYSIIDFMPINAKLASLRVLRVLRPLRSINAIKRMKSLVNTLIKAMPNFGNVLTFLLFIFILFGVFGLQIYAGSFYQRCRTTPVPIQTQIGN